MSIALLEHLLAFSNQAKWLAASIFLLLSFPVLLPLLLLCSFLGLMLLLPLGCALVGFLSWQRLHQPAAAAEPYPAPIRDEKQEKQMLAETDEVAESESSISDVDCKEIAEIYRTTVSDDLFSEGEWPVIDFDIESLNDKAACYEILLSDDDYSKEAASLTSSLASPRLNVEGCDVVEADKPECFYDKQNCLSDIVDDQTSYLFNEQEEMWYQEMQLELEKYEMLHAPGPADKHNTDWIDWIDIGAASRVDWISGSDASSDAKTKGKRGKSSSISSLLSATTGSGSISMTSTVSSTSSSSSTTWSTWSEESQTNFSDAVSSKKGSNDGLGWKGSGTALNHGRKVYNGSRPDRLNRVSGTDHQEGSCAGLGNKQTGVSAVSRKKVTGASARLLGAYVDCGRRGCVKASCKDAIGAELNGQGRKLVCRRSTADSIGRVGEGRGTQSQLGSGAASRVRAVAGGSRVTEEEAERVSAMQEGSNYTKKGKNKISNNTGKVSEKGAGLGGGGGGVPVRTTCTTSPPGRNLTGGQISAMATRHVINKTRGRVTGGVEEATSAGGSGSARSGVEDVRRHLLHVSSEDVHKALPPYAHIYHASHEYPQFYQLLEFWRGIEHAFTTPAPRRGTSL